MFKWFCIRLAAGHKVVQMERREELRKDMEAAEAAIEKGRLVDSPWMYKGIHSYVFFYG